MLLGGMGCLSTAGAAQIDLLLDVDYATPSSTSGGVWNLYARTDERGLFSLRVPLTGINGGVTNELPFGRVNGSATNNAGFSSFTTVNDGLARQVIAGQVVAQQGGGSQQGVFYGVGTLANGSPDYPGQPAGTSDLGPSISSLNNVQNNPWGGDSAVFPTAVTVASGTFDPGAMPDFGSNPLQYQGAVFTSLGTINSPGATTLDIDFTTRVIDDLVFGTTTGDFNADGRVDGEDYTVWRDANGTTVTPFTGADGDGDGEVSQSDRAIWAANYGGTAAASTTAIPEPTAAWLAATLVAMAACRPVNGNPAQLTSIA